MLLVLTLCMSLTACSTIRGTYSAEVFGTGATMEFKGSKVTISFTAAGYEVSSVQGKYKIKGDEISFDFGSEEIENSAAKDLVESLEEPVSFEKGDDYIKIGGVKYTKKD